MIATPAKSSRTAGRRAKPSRTAAKIARGVAFVARDPVHATFLPHHAAASIEDLCRHAGVIKPWMSRLFERRWYRRLVERLVRVLGPGELWRLTLRKRFVDDEVRSAIDVGARQLLIVGAGFDTLGLRVADAFPGVTVVEVDAPATAERRRLAIDAMGAHRPNHRLEAVDLAATALGDVLHGMADWHAERQTVAVAEGVLMYLGASEVGAFLRAMRDNTGAASRLVFSYVMADERGRPLMGKLGWLIRVSLRVTGEPVRWGVRDEEDLTSILEGNGFAQSSPAERFDLRRRYLVPAGIDQPVGQIERFAVAEKVETPPAR